MVNYHYYNHHHHYHHLPNNHHHSKEKDDLHFRQTALLLFWLTLAPACVAYMMAHLIAKVEYIPNF